MRKNFTQLRKCFITASIMGLFRCVMHTTNQSDKWNTATVVVLLPK